MRVFHARTASDAWVEAARAILEDGNEVPQGRGGTTIELQPATIVIDQPCARWVHARLPALNPAFAIAEVVWIVNGRNEADFLNAWNPDLPRFAGDVDRYHGAYGHRLRHHHGVDQFLGAYEALRANENTRQVVLQIWDAAVDLPTINGTPRSADIPCNTQSILKIRDGALHWTQVMRSNDVFRGFPYNVVQFTYLQEFLAGALGVRVGRYTHIADSLHIYAKDIQAVQRSLKQAASPSTGMGTSSFLAPYSEVMEGMALLNEHLNGVLKSDSSLEPTLFDALPRNIRDLGLIAAADIARRRGLDTACRRLSSECSSKVLLHMWNRWMTRTMRRRGSSTT